MKLSRPSRFVAALIALFSILFMQFAVAAYACPGMQTGQDRESDHMSMSIDAQEMSDCTGMDMAQPSLCHAYSHVGNQSLDKPELPTIQPFVPATLAAAPIILEDSTGLFPAQPAATLLTRTTAPPLSIRNCCFRI